MDVKQVLVYLENGECVNIKKEDFFLLLYNNEKTDNIECYGNIDNNFIQELLICNPIEQFAKQYESGEIN